MDKRKTNDPARNPDPITKEPGAHPVGAGVGAAAGGAIAAGAAMGTVAGPMGTAVGAAIGAVAGGLFGKGVAEGINPTAERRYWQENYATRPYVNKGASFDEYAPAYQYGWESSMKHAGKSFEDVEDDLADNWEKARGKSRLTWDSAGPATRDAWDRVYRGK